MNGKAFNSEIEEDIVEKIMLLDVESNWKVLLIWALEFLQIIKMLMLKDIAIMLLL